MRLARVYWRSLKTPAKGSGDLIPIHIANKIVDRLNKKYAGEVEHWVVDDAFDANKGEIHDYLPVCE